MIIFTEFDLSITNVKKSNEYSSFQEDLGVKNSFLVWYIYAMTEAIISDVLIPIGVFIFLR